MTGMVTTSVGTVLAMDAIERLREAVGDDAFLTIVDAYVDDATNLIDAIDGAIAAGDAEAVAFSAHQLRSGSQLLGLTDLDEMARSLELLGLAGSLDGAAELVATMRAAYADATVALRALRG